MVRNIEELIKPSFRYINKIYRFPNINDISNSINSVNLSVNLIEKKILIIELLNKKDIKNILINLPISNKHNNKYSINWNDLSNRFDNYPVDINILHLVIFHNIDIDKLLIFLLFLCYHIRGECGPIGCLPIQHSEILSNGDTYFYILYAEIKNIFYDVINSADKFDKYIYYYNNDYESLFLSDYNKIIELEDKLYKLTEEYDNKLINIYSYIQILKDNQDEYKINFNEEYDNKLKNIYSSIQILKDNQEEYKINFNKKYYSINEKLDIIKSEINKKYFLLANKVNELYNKVDELSDNFNALYTKFNNLSNRYIYNYIYKIINLYSNIKNRLLKNNISD